MGSYDTTTFNTTYGFATTFTDPNNGTMEGVIAAGDGPIHCGTEKSNTPPSGDGVIIAIPALMTGTFSTAEITVYHDVGGNFNAVGSTGSVDVIATSATVQATLAYSFTDSNGKVYSANGTVEVVVCAP